jgi:predicted transcriptional regulator
MDAVSVTPVSVWLKPDLRTKLNFLAEASRQTKSDVLRRLIDQATLQHVQTTRIEAEIRLTEKARKEGPNHALSD